MYDLIFDIQKAEGKFKILNATNGGPWHRRHTKMQYRSNFKEYKEARIPYSRNHDSGMQGIYGGPFSHDVSKIFVNFDADVNTPASYDFGCTDEAILATLEAGTRTFFRLGETIENQIKKHHTLPPKDFKKWALICEHIIRHYTEGWADGFELDMPYWEIWNEPDLHEDTSPAKTTWGGTKAEFFDFYEIAAKHLKEHFPNLKIGGPALAYREDWAEDFLKEMRKRNVPIDFFSWHIYCTEPSKMIEKANNIKKLLCENGYEKAESILNEWNYIKGWQEEFLYSIDTIHGIKGAAFIMACISEAQKTDCVDMLMYYDTRPTSFCGAFDFYTYRPLKGYYPFKWYGMFYDMENEIRCLNQPENIYTICGIGADNKLLCVVTHYSDDDDTLPKDINIDFGRKGNFEIYLLDGEHDAELIGTKDKLSFTLPLNSSIMIKEI